MMLALMLTSLLLTSLASAYYQYEAPEPFEYLNGHDNSGNPPRPHSPDPLVQTTWSSGTNTSELQVYRVRRPVAVEASSRTGLDDWLDGTALRVVDSMALQLDWGVERAAWFECLLLGGNNTEGWTIKAGLSETNIPYPGKTLVMKQYGDKTFRLETNDELYEGIRYTWLYLEKHDDTVGPISIQECSLMAKIKPISYSGSFESSDETLEKVWYTGAYGVRLNMEANSFNSILLERGDRVAIQGDGHPTMAAALSAFGSPNVYDMILKQLWSTNSGHVHGHNVVDDSIMAYPLYWTLSVLDWFMASGDSEHFMELVPDIMSILDLRVADFMQPDLDIGWMGWDDRLSNGWCFHYNHDQCSQEAHLTFGALVIRVVKDFARALEMVHDDDFATKYRRIEVDLVARFRDLPDYPNGLGVHAAANAINAGIATLPEQSVWLDRVLNDSLSICSWSAFNQYWILQGLGNANRMDLAIDSIKLCWGSMLELNKGCFYELSSPQWTRFRNDGDKLPTMPSMCHPWSSGVTHWMTTALAGIEPLLPGYKTFVVTPYISWGHPSVATQVETPGGPIVLNATLTRSNHVGDASVTISIDASVEGHVGMYRLIQGGTEDCVLDTETYPAASNVESLFDHWPDQRQQAIHIIKIEKGHTDLRIGYACRWNEHVQVRGFPEPVFPASVKLDKTSQGDGIYHYGADGYILLGANSDSSNKKLLPSYITSASFYDHGFSGSIPVKSTYVASSDSNPVFIPDQFSSKATRILGMLGEAPDTYWNPGIVVDVKTTLRGSISQDSILLDVQQANTNFDESFELSLYCVAPKKVTGKESEQFAVRVMDLETLNVIAVTANIDSQHTNGTWWTVKYNQSLRLRIMAIDGMHISAIGFSQGPVERVAQSKS